MNRLAIDGEYLQYQYGSTEKLKIRQETHRLYSERTDNFMDWMLAQVDLRPGQRVADIGCGPGAYFPFMESRGLQIIGVDRSPAMLDEAKAQTLRPSVSLAAVQADAQWLPLASSSCDRVMANHVLYHVPDQAAALTEMRRALAPGGRIVLATNAHDASQVLEDAHDAAAYELGYTVTRGVDERFNLGHLALVRSVFPSAEVVVREDAFVFPDSKPALRYYATGMIDRIEPLPADGSHRRRLLPLVKARLDAIVASAGVLRVPKNSGCFVAEI